MSLITPIARLPCMTSRFPRPSRTLLALVQPDLGNRIWSPPSNSLQLHRSSALHTQSQSAEQIMTSTSTERLDPHAYTSGRWLRRDKLERDSRYIKFDFDALCRRVVELCPGASSITSYDKKEGGFNRIFIFTTDNAKRIVARLPFAVAGPSGSTTHSEVATIEYLQRTTSIPIPKILAWSNDASNPIGSEYIIMDHAIGISLQERWPTMNGGQQVRCIAAIYKKVKETVDINFPAYGSLYFDDLLLDSSHKHTLDEKFCIGPHVGVIYWDCRAGESRYYHNTKPNRGPWLDFTTYCDGLIDAGISRVPPVDPAPQSRPCYFGSVAAHLHLLASGRAVLKKMSEDARIQDTAVPTLFHPDLHKRNIFVSEDDPTVVTGIIDWQSSSVEPSFWYADEVPDFASPVAHPSLENQLEPSSELCTKAFEASTQFLVPKLAAPRLMNEGLFRAFRYCYRTWRDGLAAFRHELIETSSHWKELGFTGSCPYPVPTPEDLAIHRKEYQTFEAAQQLRHDLSEMLNTATDGWVPPEDFEATQVAHREMYDGLLRTVLHNEDPDDDEPLRTEEDVKAIWPFDLPQVSPSVEK